MATHSRIFAWRIPGTREPGGLPSIGSHRVRHDWSNSTSSSNETLLQSTGNSAQRSVVTWMGRESKREGIYVYVYVYVYSLAQSCPTLSDCSPPGFSVHGIFQARILEWVAISYSRGSSLTQGLNPRLLHLLHWQAESSPLCYLGRPCIWLCICIADSLCCTAKGIL